MLTSDTKDALAMLEEQLDIGQQQLQKSQTTKETLLRRIPPHPHLDRRLLERLSPNSAVLTLDYKVSDLQKRLNKMLSKTESKENYFNLLVDELNKARKTPDQSETENDQRKRFLENEIHKTRNHA